MKKIYNRIVDIFFGYKDIIFFYIPLIIFVTSSYFRTFQFIFDYLEIVVTALLALGILLNIKNLNKKKILSLIFTSLIVGIIFLISKDITIVKFFLFIFAAFNINFRSCVKTDLIVRIICFCLVLLLNKFGLIPSFDITRGNIVRYSLGFYHPNDLAYKVLIMLFEYFYLNKFSSIYKNLFITFIVIYLLDFFTNSRSAELLLFFVFLIGTISTSLKSSFFSKKLINHFIKYSYYYMASLILIFYILYIKKIVFGIKINELLSGRLYLVNKFYTEFGINIFGNNISSLLSKKAPLDVGFAHILIRYGIVAFIAIGEAFKKSFKIIIIKKDISYLVILFSFVIYAITENGFFRIEQNIFMLIFSCVFYENNNFFKDKV